MAILVELLRMKSFWSATRKSCGIEGRVYDECSSVGSHSNYRGDWAIQQCYYLCRSRFQTQWDFYGVETSPLKFITS